jgi:hypothetical protein
VGLAAAVVGMSLSARDVLALTCNVASDCPPGFACPAAGVDGVDGGAESTCVSGPCASDADCAAGFRCSLPDENIGCTVGADGGQICQSDGFCAPQWEVPCTADSQCGPGFACAEDGGVAPNPAATLVTAGVIDCGPSRFDASIPSYAWHRADTDMSMSKWRTALGIARLMGECSRVQPGFRALHRLAQGG